MNRQSLQQVFDRSTKSSQIHEAVLFVESSDGSFTEKFCYGDRDIDTPMIIASITKMFTTTCILQLNEEGRLSLDDKLTNYFGEEQLKGLHNYKGREYSSDLTISDLLFQTSGLPDSFEAGDVNMDFYIAEDPCPSFEQNLAAIKDLTPQFAPNTKNKAYYANINFDLLGEILVKITGIPLAGLYRQNIFTPLGMSHTYLPVSENDPIPLIYYGDRNYSLPGIILSSGASGGCISTPVDLMIFSKAFWEGRLFDKSIFPRLASCKKVQVNKGPIRYGGGYMQIPLDTITTMFMGKGELIGHSGTTGSFLFYYPEKDLHFIGDLNQSKNPSFPIRLVMQLAMLAK